MSKKIVEYTLATARDAPELNDVVNVLIEEGWQPYGMPVIHWDEDNYTVYAQAMVRFESADADLQWALKQIGYLRAKWAWEDKYDD